MGLTVAAEPPPSLPPYSSLDCLAEAPLETSAGPAWTITAEYYGSVDHHDGFAPSLPPESQFRHSSWAAPRRRIYAALLRVGEKCRRTQHFAECGSSLWLMRDGQTLSLSCNRCHDRLCLPCQRDRQAAVVEGVTLRMLDCGGVCRFLTLTLKHSDAPLSVQLTRLVESFKQLRQHPSVKHAIGGGAWFIEVKLGKDKGRWHPHLHVIVEGEFIDQKTLCRSWYEVTGDSYIADIRSIGDVAQRARYVTKYATKPLHNEVTLQPAKLDEFVTAIKSRRLYQCFGSWSKAVKRDPPDARKLERVAALSTLHSDACGGCIASIVLMHQCHDRWPALRKSHPLPAAWQSPAPPDDA